jgi:vacuolar-type H+-ATPase subunit H
MEGSQVMDVPAPENGFTPLDQIRQAEAEVTRKIAAAREATKLTVSDAQVQAAVILDKARETGRREGQAQYREITSKAEDETRALIAQANQQADELHRNGEQRMEAAFRWAVNVVIGLEWEMKSDEP